MQELQPTPGLAGRLFGGAAGPAATGPLRRRGGPAPAEAAEVRCPRCDSANTKFCYYNNYNLAQPRHFCKACRRYWTKGGLLRNVPVGGGCRKHRPKRPASASDDGTGKNAKDQRVGCAGGSSWSAADAPNPSNDASCVATQPSDLGSSDVMEISSASTGPCCPASGDTLPVPLPPPAPMFSEQAAAFASLYTPPPRLPAFCFSAQPMAEEGVAAVLAEQPSPPHCTAAAPETTRFPIRSDGGLTAGTSDWPSSASDAVIFELAGGITGAASTSLPAYWNPGSWTESDPTTYLP